MAVVVKKDFSKLQGIKVKTSLLGRYQVLVGFQGKGAMRLYPNGVNVATVATYQEFGTQGTETNEGVPARSFLRSTMFEQRSKIAQIYADAVSAIFADPRGSRGGTSGALDSVLEHLAEVGDAVLRLVSDKLRRSKSWAKGNAPATIAKKGFDNPLHETDQMTESISWVIRDLSGGTIREGTIS